MLYKMLFEDKDLTDLVYKGGYKGTDVAAANYLIMMSFIVSERHLDTRNLTHVHDSSNYHEGVATVLKLHPRAGELIKSLYQKKNSLELKNAFDMVNDYSSVEYILNKDVPKEEKQY